LPKSLKSAFRVSVDKMAQAPKKSTAETVAETAAKVMRKGRSKKKSAEESEDEGEEGRPRNIRNRKLR
jgi:hypothetical protein